MAARTKLSGCSFFKQVTLLFCRGPFVFFVLSALIAICSPSLLAQNQAAAPAQPSTARPVQQTTILSSSAGNSLGEYLIGPDDLLSISVLESADLSRDIRVSSDGTIGLPLLAERPHVAGLSLSQAEGLVKRKYQEGGILNDPNITITLKKLHPDSFVRAANAPQRGADATQAV